MKKSFAFLCTMLLILGVAGAASAVVFFEDSSGLGTGRADWEAAVGSYVETSDFPGSTGATLPAGTPVDIGFGATLDFSQDMQVLQVGAGWATWSGGYTGEVLYTGGTTGVKGFFGGYGIGAFGLEAEPNPFSLWSITLELITGDILTQSVYGDSGAKFFGWTSDIPVAAFAISSDIDFAIGRFVAGDPVPEPATLLLLGSGLVGLAGYGRRKFKKS